MSVNSTQQNINQFKDNDGEVEISIGDKVNVVIEEIEDGEGQTKLSRQKAKNEATWAKLISATDTGEIVTGKIQNRIKGGFMVMIDDITAFLPGSLVDVRPVRETQYLEGTVSEFKVVKADKNSNNIVVSRKAALLGDSEENKGEMLSKLNEGDVVDGIIKNLTDYGAFIDLGGMDGLVHITDISWTKINSPSEILNLGEDINVKVLKFDQEEKVISATGKFEWSKELPENLEIFDPLNAQIQIRKKVIQGAKTFSILLPEIKTGEIVANKYILNADEDCFVGEKIYQCKVVQRDRPQENRITVSIHDKNGLELNSKIINILR